jgi:histone chaperone ASF1
MPKLDLVKVEIDTAKVYKVKDSFQFKLTFNNQDQLNDDVEFEIFYFGDAYSDNHDQKICHSVIGPLETGKLCFDLDTTPIDLTKVPIKTLFGLTTILIVGKFKGEQFIRIGYVVDVRYPGIDSEKLMENDDIIENEEEEELSDESGVDAAEEEEEGAEIEEEEGDENDEHEAEESNDEEEIEEDDDEGIELMNDEELEEYEDEEYNSNEAGMMEDAIAESLMPGVRKVIPLETPIVSDKDEFEYKGFSMKQSLIEMTLLEKPIIQVFDIEWGTNNKDQDEIVESSSENEENSNDLKKDVEQTKKKVKNQ